MKIATLGTGGIGGYLAVKLTLAGHTIATIARGAHLKAIIENGLELRNHETVEKAHPWIATDDPNQVGKVDAIIFGVKGDSLDSAAETCKPLLKDDTLVVPFLNGVEAAYRLGKIIPKRNVANGVARVSTTISSPGVIQQTGSLSDFIFSECDNRPSQRVSTLQSTLRESGIMASESKDINREVWSKFIFFAALSGVTAAARCTIGDIKKSEVLTRLFMTIMRETANTGKAHGVHIPKDTEDKIWKKAISLPPSIRASTALDLEKGLPLEIDWLAGAVSRLAREVGTSAPINEAIYAILSPYKNGPNLN